MESADKSSKSEYNALDDPSIPSEVVLEMLIRDVKNTLSKMETSLYLFQREGITTEVRNRETEIIGFYMQHIRNVLDDGLTYVEKRKALNAEKGDTES